MVLLDCCDWKTEKDASLALLQQRLCVSVEGTAIRGTLVGLEVLCGCFGLSGAGKPGRGNAAAFQG